MDAFFLHLQAFPDALLYVLLGVSAYVENIFPPIPGDTITAFGAFLVGIGRLDFLGVYVSTTLGSLAGFMSLFWIGLYLGRRFFLQRDYRFLKAGDIIKAEAWFKKYGYFLIAVNRFLPGIRSAISVTGGISRLNGLKVLSLAMLSCAVWNLIWILLGYTLGTRWELVKEEMSAIMANYNAAVLALFVLVVLVLLFRWKMKKGK